MISLKKNFIYSISYQILLIVLPLITTPYISRVLGADGIGKYSYTQSVAAYFVLMAMLGISQHGNRCISQCADDINKRSLFFWNIYCIQFVTHLFILLIYVIYVRIFSSNILSWLQLIYILSSLFDISWFFFGIEHFDITVGRNVIIKIITAILIFVFVKHDSDLWIYTLIVLGGILFSQTYLWFFLKRFIVKSEITLELIKAQIRPVLTLFIPVLAYSIYKIMDKIMLGIMSDYTQVGFYENAYKINNIPIGFITAIGNVMLPRVTVLLAKGKKNLVKDYIKKSFLILNVFSCALVFGIGGISSNFAVVYYGRDFFECARLMRCLNWTVFFVGWANIMRTQYLIPNRKDHIYVVSTILGAAVNLIINFLLIRKFQAYGATIGTFFAEFTVMIVQLIYLKSDLHIMQYISSSWRYFLLGTFMMIAVNVVGKKLGYGITTLTIQVLIGAGIYISGGLLIAYLNKDGIWNFIMVPILYKMKWWRQKWSKK